MQNKKKNRTICFLVAFALLGTGLYGAAPAGATASDTTAPTINVIWPAYGETVHEPTVVIKGTAYDAESGVDRVIVYNLTAHGTENWSRWGDLLVTGLNTVPITARDGAGNEVTIYHQIYYEPADNLTTIWEDFSTDSGLWDYTGDACLNNSTGHVSLTEAVDWQAGNLWYRPNLTGNFTAGFKFMAGGGDGADGIVFMFYKNRSYSPIGGGCLGFTEAFGSNVSGYGIEFDNFYNEVDMGDPCERHIALIEDYPNNHLTYAEDNRTEDNLMHFARIEVNDSGAFVAVDGDEIFSWNGSFDESYDGFGFSGATGDDNNIHVIDDVFIIHGEETASSGGGSGGAVSDTTAPTLKITWPLQNQTVYRPGVIIRGTASDAGSGVREVLVRGYPANGTTSWHRYVGLSAGWNTIPVVARDGAGNEERTKLRIYCRPFRGVFFDNFSSNSGLWEYWGNAYRDEENGSIVLTEANNSQTGIIWFNPGVYSNFTTKFRYKAGGGSGNDGSGADGLVFMFYKNRTYSPGGGVNLGFVQNYSNPWPGYGIEFDNWYNYEINDPSGNHVALIKDSVDTHLIHVNDSRTEDLLWHDVKVAVNKNTVCVELDEEELFTWTGPLDMTYGSFGFSGATAIGTNWHMIDDVYINCSGGNDSMPPILKVTWPLQNQTVNESRILIKGTAFDSESGVEKVTVYNLTANGTAAWTCRANLIEGWNTIPVVATDYEGNEEKIELRVYCNSSASWISWIDPRSDGGRRITTAELQEVIYYWINDLLTPVPEPYEYTLAEEGTLT